MNSSLRQRIARHKITRAFLNPWITLGSLLLLLILVFFGTLYQTEHGLYEAQKIYFGYQWVLLGGYVPVPGSALVLWVLSFQLLLTMFFVYPLKWKKVGLWIVHLGLLILLVGGFITQTLSVESQLTLAEGELGNFTTSYHDWELAVWKNRGDTNHVVAYEDRFLKTGATLDFAPLPVRITVQQFFSNAEAFSDKATGGISPYLNTAGIAYIEARKPEKEVVENAPGLVATVSIAGEKEKQALWYGLEPRPLTLKVNGEWMFFQLRRRHYPLPFSLKLTDFVRILHPGTDIARTYESYAELQDGLSSRPVKIWMNNPLRYAGYTLFQASFSQDEKKIERSTFAVVTNPGRLTPYISSLTVFAGMLLHFILRFMGYVKRTNPT